LSVVAAGLVLLPLTALLRRVDRLAPLSGVTAVTAVVFLGFVVARTATGPGSFPAAGLEAGPCGDKPGIIWLEALSMIVIGYVVQFNVLPVYLTLPAAGRMASMMQALTLGMGLTFTLYVATGLLSYLTFGLTSYDDIVDAYTSMPAGEFATIQLGIGQLLSYPILAHAAIVETAKLLLPYFGPCIGASSAPTEKSTLLVDKAPPPADAADAAPSSTSRISEAIAGTLWVVLTTGLAVLLEDVSSLISLVGAACATPLMTVFPPLMLLRCAAANDEPYRAAHAVMVALGCLATVAGLIVAILDWGES